MAEEKRPVKYKGAKCLGTTRAKGNTKDTKKWCKGVPGREHDKLWVIDPRHQGRHPKQDIKFIWRILQCSVCQKEFDYCYNGYRWGGTFVCKCGYHPREVI